MLPSAQPLHPAQHCLPTALQAPRRAGEDEEHQAKLSTSSCTNGNTLGSPNRTGPWPKLQNPWPRKTTAPCFRLEQDIPFRKALRNPCHHTIILLPPHSFPSLSNSRANLQTSSSVKKRKDEVAEQCGCRVGEFSHCPPEASTNALFLQAVLARKSCLSTWPSPAQRVSASCEPSSGYCFERPFQ